MKMQFLKLKDRLDHLIEADKDDSIRFYFLCENCKHQIDLIRR
jgi:CRISPR/Cas system-associated endoribonuclease Cas2